MAMSVMLVLLVLLVFTQATLILAVEAAAVDISMLPLGVNTGGQQLLASSESRGWRSLHLFHQVLAGPQFRPRDSDKLGHTSPLHLNGRTGPGGYLYKGRDCSFEFKIV